MPTPTQPTVTLTLEDREFVFTWGNAAIFSVSSLPMKTKGSYANVVALLWAALTPADSLDFPTPKHFARFVDPAKASEIYEQIIPKIIPPKASPEVEAKNADGSTPKHSPSSS